MTTFGFRSNVFSMGDQFTTANSYPRQVANPADTVMTMVQGASIAINAAASGANGAQISWRFEGGALTFSGASSTAIPSAGFATDRPIGV